MSLLKLVFGAALVAVISGDICSRLLECKRLIETSPAENPLGGGNICQLKDGSSGVLCSTPATGLGNRFGSGQSGAADTTRVVFPGATAGSTPPVSVFDIQPLKHRFKFNRQQTLGISRAIQKESVLSEAKRKLTASDQKIRELSQSGVNIAKDRTSEHLQLLFGQPQSTAAEDTGRLAQQSVQVLVDLSAKRALSHEGFQAEEEFIGDSINNRGNFLPISSIPGEQTIPGCEKPKDPICDAASEKFRRHNGECNNVQEPRLGSASTAFSRFFPAEYEDGIFEPRKSGSSGPLPSPRLVSERVVSTSLKEDRFRTVSVMQWGQFINHDMISTPTFRAENGRGLSCCDPGNKFPEQPLHPIACNPIRVPADDPFYAQFGRTCMNHVRSMAAPFERCVAGPTSQLNQVSQFLDASNVYGSSEEQANRLRLFSGGLIKTSEGNLLPEQGGRFISGEGRLSENPGLTFMHTIWTREHNRVANQLALQQPTKSDEDLYQEARRITIGEYQNIVYNEYIPTVLGFAYTRTHGLDPNFGQSFSYNQDVDPRINTEFSTAAFRFGHSQIQDAWILSSKSGQIQTTLRMEDAFFQTDVLREPDAMAQLARSLTRQKARAVDKTFSSSVHEKLFAVGAPSGLDLIALNINRGRDHGLPTYVTALENCLGHTIQGGWRGLKPFFDRSVLLALKSVYGSIYDIDLFIGGVAEKHKPGTLVGEVFQCIIGEQFFATRYGDRFFYDNGNQKNSFSHDQVRELQQSNWARILCDNIDGLSAVQPLAFWQSSLFLNSLRHCNSFAIPLVDLSVF